MTVGERIKNKRKELHLTQEQLANIAGYSNKSDISKMENSGNEIGLNRIEKIAKALNVSMAYLMGWEEPKTEKPTLSDKGYQIGLAYDKADARTKIGVEVALGIDFEKKSAKVKLSS